MSKATIYIAGPMSGLPGFNRGAFADAAEHLALLGYDPLSPARHEQDPHKTWADWMRLGIRDVTSADGVWLLDDWQASRGACLEVHVAHALGLTVLPARRWSRDTLGGAS